MMRKFVLIAALALLLPALAFAGKPSAPGKSDSAHTKKAHTVMYVLRGTLTAYTAATTTTPGSVSILVQSANHRGASLVTKTLTFPTSTATKIAPHATSITLGDPGMVKVRGPKTLAPTDNLATVLQALTAFQVVDHTGGD